MDIAFFKEFGLVGIVMGAVISLLFLVVKWTLNTTKCILNQAAEERKEWHKAISDHTEQAKAFHDQVTEAHKYQREEHQGMIRSLHQVEQALGRINGYTK